MAMLFRNSDLEAHFKLCVYLMLFFFGVDFMSDALVQFGLTHSKIMGGTAHDTFMAFFGIAIGIFRGMSVPNQKGINNVQESIQPVQQGANSDAGGPSITGNR
jgi:hypothetical protein